MRIDFYTSPHKRQRKDMFQLSAYIGEADLSNTAQFGEIEKLFSSLLLDLHHHVCSEETFVHPLLIHKMPHVEKNLHREHEELEITLEKIEKSFKHLQQLTPVYPKYQEQGLEFYRALNRFIANYLIHIDEEEYVMQNLWEISADPELRGMMIAFQVSDGLEKGRKWLSTNLPAMNIEERLLMYKTTQLLAPEKIFQTMCQLSEEILGPKEWEVVRGKLDQGR